MASGKMDSAPHAYPEGVFSLLDTDLYKLTMQSAVLKYFPDVGVLPRETFLVGMEHLVLTVFLAEVTYTFTNRTPHMKLTRAAFNWLQSQVQSML